MSYLSIFSLKKVVIFHAFVVCLFFVASGQAHAATLGSASGTLTTSRPSPSSPLSANAAASSGLLSIFNNGSHFLASDSAKIIRDTPTHTGTLILNSNLNVASQSAGFTTVYLTNSTTNFSGAGADVLFSPITAMHKIAFTTQTTIPIGGRIVITFPGTGDNSASPSASGFAFNNLTAGNVQANFSSGSSTCTMSITAPTITCTVATAQIAGGTLVTILIGCSAQTGGNCTTQVPTLINPTKSNQSEGVAEVWRVGIQTQDNSGTPVNLDDARIALATVESVTVRATVDPSLSFSIAGVANGVALNAVPSVNGCTQLDTTNTGISSSAVEVGLGSLSVPPPINTRVGNIAAQSLIVATNTGTGYSITATSSGPLKNPSTGFFLNTALTPQAFPTTSNYFGLHACGEDTDQTQWSSNSVQACNTYVTGSSAPICLYSWPTTTSPVLIAQRASGPVGVGSACNSTGCGQNVVSYAATQDVSIPPGNYTTVVTYVATPSF